VPAAVLTLWSAIGTDMTWSPGDVRFWGQADIADL